MAAVIGVQTSQRYGNAALLAADFVIGIGDRWAKSPTASVDVDTNGRTFVHIDIEPTQIGRVFNPDYGIVSDSNAGVELLFEQAQPKGKRPVAEPLEMARGMPGKPAYHAASRGFRQYSPESAARVPGNEQGVRAGNVRPGGPLGSTAALGMRVADPDRPIVALSGDYGFQFMIEELAVGAQFKLPYIHVLVNNSYVGWIRQSQHGFSMDYCAPLGFDNLHPPELQDHDMDRVKMAQGLGGDAIRVSLDLRRLNRLAHSPKQR
jgi:tartronate-semialdehyde synthase